MKKIFVGNIPFSYNDRDLINLFSSCGNVVGARVIKDKYSGLSRGFGLVEMSQGEEAQKAIEIYNGKEMMGERLVVNESF